MAPTKTDKFSSQVIANDDFISLDFDEAQFMADGKMKNTNVGQGIPGAPLGPTLVDIPNIPPAISSHNWSDLPFLCWQHACQNNEETAQNIPWIIRDTIENDATGRVIQQEAMTIEKLLS